MKLVFDGPPILCEQGLHASLEPFQALRYAPGSNLHLVECGGMVIQCEDKLVCTERTIIVSMNAEPLLRYFARMQALSVVHMWDAPDVVLDFLMGDDAAWSAAESAARSAAWSAARSAAGSATWSAAESAAWSAAESAAESAAGSAAGSAAEQMFNELVYDAFADWLNE
jgi:hypothetical protein